MSDTEQRSKWCVRFEVRGESLFCARCGVPAEEHLMSDDRPIPPAEGLDFEAARTEALRADYTAMGETFQSNVPWAQYEAMYKMPLMSSLRAALNTQYREAVARARREVLEEVMAEWTKPTIRTHAEAYQFVSDFTCWMQGKLLEVR